MSNESEPLDVFDEHEPSVQVKIRSVDGSIKVYEIGELPEPDGLARWMSLVSVRFPKDKPSNFKGMHEDLIELCITLNGEKVPRSTINGWGTKLKSRLFDICQRVNGLTDDAVKREGKG